MTGNHLNHAGLIVIYSVFLVTAVGVFLFGWWARGRKPKPKPPARLESVSYPRPTLFTDRSGRLELTDWSDDALPSTGYEPAMNRHWLALERTAAPETRPFSHVQISNWERAIQRRQRQWEHDHGISHAE